MFTYSNLIFYLVCYFTYECFCTLRGGAAPTSRPVTTNDEGLLSLIPCLVCYFTYSC